MLAAYTAQAIFCVDAVCYDAFFMPVASPFRVDLSRSTYIDEAEP
jgi:hypothetical protein